MPLLELSFDLDSLLVDGPGLGNSEAAAELPPAIDDGNIPKSDDRARPEFFDELAPTGAK